jgi:endonuclease/exonuclease/phosphatase family metal-dependent hydrolase
MNTRNLLTSMLAVLLLALTCHAQQATPGKLTLMAYNVENMFDVFDDPYASDETMQPKSRASIERVAMTIRQINPDVIGISEVENAGILRAMVNEMLADMGYRHISVLPTNSDRGINLGVISRVPIVSLTSHRFMELTLPDESRTWTFARDLLKVTVQATPEQRMDVFIVHFKSRHDSGGDPMSAKWRMAEHTMAQKKISDILKNDPQAWVVIMGDFNDTPDAPGIQAYAPMLHDVHARLDPDRPITYLKGRYRSVIDYIFASPALYQRLDSVGIPTNEAELLEGSDHAPVWATFRIE